MNKHLLSRITLGLATIASIGVWAQESESILFVTSDQLDSYWIAEKKVAPVYPTKSLRNHEEGCVAVGFIIEPDGTTSNHQTVIAFPSSNFNKSAIRAAKQFVYKPSEQNSVREVVFTTNSFTFQITSSRKFDEQKQKKLADVCTSAANKSLNTDTVDAGAG
jgi:TonB family protein